MKHTFHSLLLSFFLLFILGKVNATIIYVDASKTSGLNDGSNWVNAYTALQAALDIAVSGDQIWVAAGTYYPTKELGGTDARFKTFELKSGISIYGGFAGTEVTLNERNYTLNLTKFSGDIGVPITDYNNFSSVGWNDNVFHVFSAISNGTLWSVPAKIDGCEITGGYATTYSNSKDHIGGGILMYKGGYVELFNNKFDYNYSSVYGGAIGNFDNSKVIIKNCTITRNRGEGEVGGIWNEANSTAEVYNSVISYNSAKFISGMLNLGNSNCIVSNCIFSNNSSNNYGAFTNYRTSTAILDNCLFYSNTNTLDYGGSISNISSDLTANNLTIVNNTSPKGGGLYNTGTLTINNSIVWGNTGTAGKQIYNSSGTTILNYSCYSNSTEDVCGSITATNNNINQDPLFVDANVNDFRLYRISPCVDAGDNSYNSELYDIRGAGFGRRLDKTNGNSGTIDIGAYEYKFGSDPFCFGINPSSGGRIDANQNICYGSNPLEITNTTFPSGHSGILEYKWQKSTTNDNTGFSDIIGAVGDSYKPGILNETTWYKRLSKVTCIDNWIGASESNIVKIAVNPAYDFTENHTICEGDAYNWQGTDISTTGTYTASYKSINGCDSTYTLNLTVNSVYNFTEDHSICEGDTYHWQGVDRSTTGTYAANFKSINGCDSTYTLNLTVNPLPESVGIITGQATICQGQNSVSYTIVPIANANSYSWSLPDGATGVSSTNSIEVNFGLTAKSGNITVKGNNSCGNGNSSSLAINVNEKPSTPIISLDGIVLHSNAQEGNQWYNNLGVIYNAINQDYTVNTSGDYYTIVTLLGCSSNPSNTINVVVSGINVNDESKKIKVYPIPFSNELIIEFNENEKPTNYEIINTTGNIVLKGCFTKETSIQTRNFAPGIYIVKIGNETRYEYRKVIKE